MALLLAFETSGPVCSIGLLRQDQVIAVQEVYIERLHARLVTAAAEQLLANLSLTPRDLQGVVTSHGPGSYTGLRIGTSAAKGLCMALDIPLLAVPTTVALAQQVATIAQYRQAHVLALVDARRQEVYAQHFAPDLRALDTPTPVILKDETWQDLAAQHPLLFVGDGATKLPAQLMQHPQVWALPDIRPSVRGFGPSAWAQYQAGQFQDVVTYEPHYLKPPGTNQ